MSGCTTKSSKALQKMVLPVTIIYNGTLQHF